MSAAFLTAALAAPATRTGPVDFAAGRERLASVTDPLVFNFGDPIAEIEALLPDLDPDDEVTDEAGVPVLAYAQQAGAAIIDHLEQGLTRSQEVNVISVAGYDLYIAGGMSFGDDPSDGYMAIADAHKLPEGVLTAMGFIPDCTQPLARKNGNPGHVTDTDVVDAIALGLGTQSDWSRGDCLEWIADDIGTVRSHPGNAPHPEDYLAAWRDRFGFDPLTDNFLADHVDDEATEEDAEHVRAWLGETTPEQATGEARHGKTVTTNGGAR